MLKFFLLRHFDAILTTMGGIWVIHTGWKLSKQEGKAQTAGWLKLLGSGLVLIGLLRFAIDPPPPENWQRIMTRDGQASIEFPSKPLAQESTQSLQGQTLHTLSWVHSFENKHICLIINSLDTSAIAIPTQPDEQFKLMKQGFVEKGYVVMDEGPMMIGDVPGFHLHAKLAKENEFMWTRVIYQGPRIYRAVAAGASEFDSDPAIQQFLNSFRIEQASGK